MFTVNSHGVASINILVIENERKITIPKANIDELFSPETLTLLKDGIAKTKTRDQTDKRITVTLS